jgi:hypothetical protein
MLFVGGGAVLVLVLVFGGEISFCFADMVGWS